MIEQGLWLGESFERLYPFAEVLTLPAHGGNAYRCCRLGSLNDFSIAGARGDNAL
jgi:hypothetical protein